MSFERQISRRDFLRYGAIQAGKTALALAAAGAGIYVLAEEYKSRNDLTDQQKKALDIYRNAKQEDFVHNIVAMGSKEGDKVIPVNLRNKPETPADKDDFSFGKIVGDLEPNTVVDKAIVVLGNDPRVPFDKDSRDFWYAFMNPKDTDEIVFANDSVFAPNPQKLNVTAFDLSA